MVKPSQVAKASNIQLIEARESAERTKQEYAKIKGQQIGPVAVYTSEQNMLVIINGKQVKEIKMNGFAHIVTSDFNKGLYTVLFKSDKGRWIKELVIQ